MKKILLMFVAALSMALASCSGALEPTGDVNKDAASLGEKMISMLQGVKSFDDIAKLNIDLTSLQQKFIEFYKSKGEEGGFLKALTDFGKQHAAELGSAISDSKLADAAKGVLSAACAGAIIPSGDVNKDVQGLFDWFLDKTKAVKSLDEMKDLDSTFSSLGDSFNSFYGAKGEDALAEFNKVGEAYAAEHKAELDAAQAEVTKNLGLDQLANMATALGGAETALDEGVESAANALDKSLNAAADTIQKQVKKAANDAVNAAAKKAGEELTKALGF